MACRRAHSARESSAAAAATAAFFSARALPSRASLSEWDDSALSASAALRSSAPAIARATAARTVGIGPANAFADAFAVPGRECEPRRGGGPQRPPPGDGRVAANATSIAPSEPVRVRAGAGFVLKQALLGRVSSTSSDSDDAEHDDAECSSSSSSAVASVASSAESRASPRRAIPEESSGRLGSYGSKTRGRSAPQAMALTSATSIASSSESEEDTLAASRSFSVAFRGAETSTRFPMESLGPADSQFPESSLLSEYTSTPYSAFEAVAIPVASLRRRACENARAVTARLASARVSSGRATVAILRFVST